MRLRSVIGLLFASLLVLVTGGPATYAQYDDDTRLDRRGGYAPQRRGPPPNYGGRYQQPYGSPYGRPPPQPYYGNRYEPPPSYGGRYQQPAPRYGDRYAPLPQRYGGRYEPPPQQPPSSGFFFPWLRPAPQPQYEQAPRRPASVEPRRRLAPRPVPQSRAVAERPKAKTEAASAVVVFGDSLAELVAQGLEEAFEDNPSVAVVRKTRGDSGLARTDHYDWPKAVQELLGSTQKISYAVVMLGANDRQTIREGETAHDPLSDRWRELYRDRVDAVLRPFQERRIPVVWVGTPPMKNDRLSADLMAMNDIFRERVQRVGGVYVDIWEAFVNDENRYSPVGPDVGGQVARLRTNDGVHFTKAGARKAAHFADVELKRLLETQTGTAPATPSAPGDSASVDRLISASLPALPEPSGLPSLAARPVAGPVVPLTRVDVSPGGALASGLPRLDGDTAQIVERAFRDGLPPPVRPGRADDFSWPKP
jgi:hypothetical protein